MAKRNYRLQPRVIGDKGTVARRVIVRDGYEYHVTKGWRNPVKNNRILEVAKSASTG